MVHERHFLPENDKRGHFFPELPVRAHLKFIHVRSWGIWQFRGYIVGNGEMWENMQLNVTVMSTLQ